MTTWSKGGAEHEAAAEVGAPPRLLAVPGVLTRAECAAEIARAEAVGFDAAPVSTYDGAVMMPEVRNNARVMVDDPARAAWLWERVRAHVPARLLGRAAVGLNERLRTYRYEPGQRFRPHRDGWFERPSGERSYYTLLVYLSDDCAGGETRVEVDGDDVVIAPVAGAALLFRHQLVHEGREVTRGRKYVLRSDVMYAARRA